MDNKFEKVSFVIDTEGILHHGQPMNLTSIDGNIATVEFFEGKEGIHKVEKIELQRLKAI